MATYNTETKGPYTLSLSIGFEAYHPDDNITMDQMISAADGKMYQMKKAKR